MECGRGNGTEGSRGGGESVTQTERRLDREIVGMGDTDLEVDVVWGGVVQGNHVDRLDAGLAERCVQRVDPAAESAGFDHFIATGPCSSTPPAVGDRGQWEHNRGQDGSVGWVC